MVEDSGRSLLADRWQTGKEQHSQHDCVLNKQSVSYTTRKCLVWWKKKNKVLSNVDMGLTQVKAF